MITLHSADKLVWIKNTALRGSQKRFPQGVVLCHNDTCSIEKIIDKKRKKLGKKGGEFYTPAEVSMLLAKLVEPKENDRIYDPACGSGSLLLKAAREMNSERFSIYGQESNSSTYNLCRMNMFLHGVNDAHIEWGDTLANPLHLENDDLMKFNVIVSSC